MSLSGPGHTDTQCLHLPTGWMHTCICAGVQTQQMSHTAGRCGNHTAMQMNHQQGMVHQQGRVLQTITKRTCDGKISPALPQHHPSTAQHFSMHPSSAHGVASSCNIKAARPADWADAWDLLSQILVSMGPTGASILASPQIHKHIISSCAAGIPSQYQESQLYSITHLYIIDRAAA